MIINQVFRLLDDVEKTKTGIQMFDIYIHSVMMVFYSEIKDREFSFWNSKLGMQKWE